jgi:hypothetical protein
VQYNTMRITATVAVGSHLLLIIACSIVTVSLYSMSLLMCCSVMCYVMVIPRMNTFNDDDNDDEMRK